MKRPQLLDPEGIVAARLLCGLVFMLVAAWLLRSAAASATPMASCLRSAAKRSAPSAKRCRASAWSRRIPTRRTTTNSRSRWSSVAHWSAPRSSTRCSRSPTRTAQRSRAAGCWTTTGGRSQGPALSARGGQQGLHRHDQGRPDRRRRRPPGQGRKTQRLHRAARSGGRLRLAGQRAAGTRKPRPAGGVGQRAGSRRRVPAHQARRNCRSSSPSSSAAAAAAAGTWTATTPGTTRRHERHRTPLSKLAEPVYVNRFVLGGKNNERVLTYLPLQDIEELQQAGPVLRGDEAHRHVQGRVRDRVLHRQRPRPAYARLQGQAVRACRSLESGAPISGVELKVLDADGEPVLKGEHRPQRQCAARLQARCRRTC